MDVREWVPEKSGAKGCLHNALFAWRVLSLSLAIEPW